MSIYAVVKDCIVVDCIVWDGVNPYNPGSQYTLVIIPDGVIAGIGYLWDAVNGFSAPPATDPVTDPIQ